MRCDARYYRPTEVDILCGDATKAREKLGWQPTVTFEKLVEIMMEADMTQASHKATPGRQGENGRKPDVAESVDGGKNPHFRSP